MTDRQRRDLLVWLLEQAKRQAEILAISTYHIDQAQGQAEQAEFDEPAISDGTGERKD